MEHLMAKLLEDFEQGRINRRQLLKSLALTAVAATAVSAPQQASAASEGKVFRAVAFNHVSYSVNDYAKTRDFYSGLFGMKVTKDDGKQCRLVFGDNILIPRNRPKAPLYDHIAYTIADWDKVKDSVAPELTRRGLPFKGEAKSSFHVTDPNGFIVQFGGTEQ